MADMLYILKIISLPTAFLFLGLSFEKGDKLKN